MCSQYSLPLSNRDVIEITQGCINLILKQNLAKSAADTIKSDFLKALSSGTEKQTAENAVNFVTQHSNFNSFYTAGYRAGTEAVQIYGYNILRAAQEKVLDIKNLVFTVGEGSGDLPPEITKKIHLASMNRAIAGFKAAMNLSSIAFIAVAGLWHVLSRACIRNNVSSSTNNSEIV